MITIKKTTHDKLLKINSISREIFAWIGFLFIVMCKINPKLVINIVQMISGSQ